MKNLEKAMESQMLILIVVIECSTLLEYIYTCECVFNSVRFYMCHLSKSKCDTSRMSNIDEYKYKNTLRYTKCIISIFLFNRTSMVTH